MSPSPCHPGSGLSAPLQAELDRILEAHTLQGEDTRNRLLGASFIVVDGDAILYRGSSGRTDLAPTSPKWTTTTPSWFASMTKLLTSISLLQLVGSGLITPDADVRAHLPVLSNFPVLHGFSNSFTPITSENNSPTTLQHLLSHTSGLPYDFLTPLIPEWRRYQNSTATTSDWSVEGFTVPLIFAPGSSFAYGTGCDWAGFLLEKLTGQSLSEYMQQHIFSQLGMPDSTFYPSMCPGYEERMPAVVERDADGLLKSTSRVWPPRSHELESGGAGLYSTAEDYTKVVQAVLKGGVLLKEAEVEEMLFSPVLKEDQQKAMGELMAPMWGPGYGEGYNWGVGESSHSLGGMVVMGQREGRKTKGSIMWGGVRGSHWWVDRETGIAAVLATSIETLSDPIIGKLYDELELALYGGLEQA